MVDVLRLVEDLIPLVDAPANRAVETLKRLFGAPNAAQPGQETLAAWPTAGVVVTPGPGQDTTTISLYCEQADGFQPFKGSLSATAPLPEDRRAVRKSLGEPTAGRTNPRLSLNRLISSTRLPTEWDRYESSERVIHFEYDASRRVKRITLTSATAASE